MNRKQYGKRKKLRKRKIKRLMIAYLLRTIVILIPIIMMILMVCGCLYIYERFTKEDEKVNKYTDIYTDRNAGNDVAPVANDSNADFFISLHCNYCEKDAQIAGLECYYNNSNAAESKAYAESIINAVSLSEDIETRYAKTEGYYVLRNTQMPAVLVEMGFLSNYSESQKLLDDDYQESLAQRIAEGISNEIKRGENL